MSTSDPTDPPTAAPDVHPHGPREHTHGDHAHGDHAHGDHGHGHGGHGHGGHGHAHDQGWVGARRYLKLVRRMWRSDINRAVVDLVGPQADERVVDIGAGMGAGAVLVADRDALAIAVEPTPFLRRTLEVRARLRRDRHGIDVVDGAAETVPVPDASIDAAYAVNTMHHWIDPDRAVVELARIVAPGGRLVLVDEDFEDPGHPEHERFGRRQGGHDHPFVMVDPAVLAQRLEAAGFAEADADLRLLAGRPVRAVLARR